MNVLVTWGSKRGGTAGIATIVGNALQRRGIDVVLASADEVETLESIDAVIVGGALYANCWPANARHFVLRFTDELRERPVWFFFSGPLDDSAQHDVIPPTEQVAVLAERVGALGHITFGGRLEEDAAGFPASAMADERAGDWRHVPQIEAWAAEIAAALPTASPGKAIDHAARSPLRLVAHGVVGWALCAAAMALLLRFLSPTWALVLHALAAPLIFVAVAHHYFDARGAHEPTTAAASFVGIVLILDAVVVAGLLGQGLALFASLAGIWLPSALIFGATWATGGIMATLPWPEPEDCGGKPTQRPAHP